MYGVVLCSELCNYLRTYFIQITIYIILCMLLNILHPCYVVDNEKLTEVKILAT